MLSSWVSHKDIGQPLEKRATSPSSSTLPSDLLLQAFSKGSSTQETQPSARLGKQLPCLLKKIKSYTVLFFLEVYPPLKSCYYNAKLDLGFSKESKVISCPTPTGLPRELDPKCLWLFWKTPSITEIYRMAQ